MSMWFVCLRGRSSAIPAPEAASSVGATIEARCRTGPAHTTTLVCGNFRTHMASNRGLSNQPQVNSCNRTNKI